MTDAELAQDLIDHHGAVTRLAAAIVALEEAKDYVKKTRAGRDLTHWGADYETVVENIESAIEDTQGSYDFLVERKRELERL